MTAPRMALAALVAALSLSAGYAARQSADDETLAREIAQGLIAACPLAAPNDEKARDLSAERLTQFARLRDAMQDPLLWGGQQPGNSYRPEDNHLTVFNPFVWRRTYLCLFMFTGEYSIEQVEEFTVLHMPCRFRGELDPGAYPYPFWHSKKKWDNYQRAMEVIFVFENGRIIAAYRSGKEDPNRSAVARAWDGQWHWRDAAGQEMPKAALYRSLFSAANPHVSRLEAAYRALEAEARRHECFVCHSPSNVSNMAPLRLLNYPNQSLSVRHEVVTVLEEKRMPPVGIEDDDQRRKLLELAREFAALGDQALDYEREFKPGN